MTKPVPAVELFEVAVEFHEGTKEWQIRLVLPRHRHVDAIMEHLLADDDNLVSTLKKLSVTTTQLAALLESAEKIPKLVEIPSTNYEHTSKGGGCGARGPRRIN